MNQNLDFHFPLLHTHICLQKCWALDIYWYKYIKCIVGRVPLVNLLSSQSNVDKHVMYSIWWPWISSLMVFSHHDALHICIYWYLSRAQHFCKQLYIYHHPIPYKVINSSFSLKEGNYAKKRCYELDLSIFYKIPGGLTLSPAQVTTKVTPTFNILAQFVVRSNRCKDITLTKGDVSQSPPGQSDVMIKATLVFKANDSVPDSEVNSNLSSCIQNTLGYKSYLDGNLPDLNIDGKYYSAYNKSTISAKRSCCGGLTPPPCCSAGSAGVSSAYCGKWLTYYCISPSAPNC